MHDNNRALLIKGKRKDREKKMRKLEQLFLSKYSEDSFNERNGIEGRKRWRQREADCVREFKG